MSNWYIGSTKYTAVAQWAATTVYAANSIVRQLLAPAVGSERCFQTTAGGTSGGSEPSWVLTAGGTSPTDGTITDWKEITGQAAKNGDGGGSAYAAPHARLANAFASGWMASGDTGYVSNNHSETQATAITLTSPGTAANPCSIICVNDSAVPPTSSATTAAIATTGASNITISGAYAYYYGLNLNAGNSSNAANVSLSGSAQCKALYLDSCNFTLNNTSSSSAFTFPTAASNGDDYLEVRNCTFVFGSTSQKMNNNSYIFGNFIGGSIAASGSVPTTLFPDTTSGRFYYATFRDVDLSAITGTIIALGNSWGYLTFTNCKTGSGVTVFSGSFPSIGGLNIRMHNCDNAATNYKYYFANYLATIIQETTVVRSGGATDGTTPISWKITSTANSKFLDPFVSEEIAQWNALTGSSKTATIYLTTNTTLNNNDFWFELEYLGASSSLGSLVSTKMAIIGTPAGLTSDSSTWGGSITNKYKMQVTFTPQMQGPLKVRLYAAKPSVTVYVDPYIYVS